MSPPPGIEMEEANEWRASSTPPPLATCHGCSQYIYQKSTRGRTFCTRPVVFVVVPGGRWYDGTGGGSDVLRRRRQVEREADATERVNPFRRVGSFYVAGDMARL